MKALATVNLIVAPIVMQVSCILGLRPVIALLADPSRSSQKVSPIIDFFTSKWAPEYWYFCMVDLYRRTIVTGAVYFSSEPQMSLYIAVFLNFFYTILYREGTHELIQQGITHHRPHHLTEIHHPKLQLIEIHNPSRPQHNPSSTRTPTTCKTYVTGSSF